MRSAARSDSQLGPRGPGFGELGLGLDRPSARDHQQRQQGAAGGDEGGDPDRAREAGDEGLASGIGGALGLGGGQRRQLRPELAAAEPLGDRVDAGLIEPGRIERLAQLAAAVSWKIAPSTATPKVAPIIRDIESSPEARPALVSATAFIAAVDIGDIVRAMPMPIRMNGTSRSL